MQTIGKLVSELERQGCLATEPALTIVRASLSENNHSTNKNFLVDASESLS